MWASYWLMVSKMRQASWETMALPNFVTGYYFCAMENIEMNERAAWRDFFDHVRPAIWGGLSRDERRMINTAERDYHGKRGKSLGVNRVERLLGRFAPGRYVVERRVVFCRVDGGELPPPDNPG